MAIMTNFVMPKKIINSNKAFPSLGCQCDATRPYWGFLFVENCKKPSQHLDIGKNKFSLRIFIKKKGSIEKENEDFWIKIYHSRSKPDLGD